MYAYAYSSRLRCRLRAGIRPSDRHEHDEVNTSRASSKRRCPAVFCYSKQEVLPFSPDPQWCPQCWQTATLLVTISSRRGGGRFPFRSASCDQITGRNSSLNSHIHQPISSHHAKLWRVAGVREPAPPARHGCGSVDISCKAHPFFCGFAPIIPHVRRLCNHFSGISYCAR